MKIYDALTSLKSKIDALSEVFQTILSPPNFNDRIHDNIALPAVFLWESGWTPSSSNNPDIRTYNISIFIIIVTEADFYGEEGYRQLRVVEEAIEAEVLKLGPEAGIVSQAHMGTAPASFPYNADWIFMRQLDYKFHGVER